MDSQYGERVRRIQRKNKSENTYRFTENDNKKNIKLENVRP